jgi:hypothetical protein
MGQKYYLHPAYQIFQQFGEHEPCSPNLDFVLVELGVIKIENKFTKPNVNAFYILKFSITYRLPGQSGYTQITFLQRWVTSHWTDSRSILKKPLIFAEFGKSKKDAGYNESVRDSFFNTVYTSIYNLARNGGTMAGGLVWQIMAEGMESYFDGNEIVLSQNPSTRAVIAQQSCKMAALQRSSNCSESKILRNNRNNQPHD